MLEFLIVIQFELGLSWEFSTGFNCCTIEHMGVTQALLCCCLLMVVPAVFLVSLMLQLSLLSPASMVLQASLLLLKSLLLMVSLLLESMLMMASFSCRSFFICRQFLLQACPGISAVAGDSYIAGVPGRPCCCFRSYWIANVHATIYIFVAAGVHVVCFCLLPVSPNGGWHWHKT